ncbi:hypothetical protein D9M71_790510 [compost metagenome]
MAGSKAKGLTCAYGSLSELCAINARASSLRSPFGVTVHPDATGFAPRVLKPACCAAYSNPAAIVVLPTSVSVPAMK